MSEAIKRRYKFETGEQMTRKKLKRKLKEIRTHINREREERDEREKREEREERD